MFPKAETMYYLCIYKTQWPEEGQEYFNAKKK